MHAQKGNPVWQSSETFGQTFFKRNFPIVLFVVLAFSGMATVYWYFTPENADAEAIAAVSIEGGLYAPIYKSVPAAPVTQRLAQSPGPLRIGIVSGHMGFDSGAVCADGLTEAEVNEKIARRVATELQSRGVRVDLLEEFDPRLDRYSATALVSVHADSCTYINDFATGFKIAGSSRTNSTDLSICVQQAYAEATQLPYHEHTITPHMTDYHVFRQLAPGTPAIIIEVGFLNLDRRILTDGANAPSSGLLSGIVCFLEARQYVLEET